MTLFKLKLSAKKLTLAICFASLYVVLSFLSISPIIGLPGKTITAAAIMTPIMGAILGSFVGLLSALLGGTIGFFVGSVSLPSFASGVFATFCAGLSAENRRSTCIFTYFSLLLLFGFYPFIGPVWLYPVLMWFQIIGFLILVSPFHNNAARNLTSPNKTAKSFLDFFIISLIATLAGQIAGSLTFEILSWPIFLADLTAWQLNWQILTLIYPIERTLIALGAAVIWASLQKILKFTNLQLLESKPHST